jgi:hypothetical protein
VKEQKGGWKAKILKLKMRLLKTKQPQAIKGGD